jgi:prophage tail gpP-like protein
MPKAIPGAPYIVLPGDSLPSIASSAYGNPNKWGLIWKANKAAIPSGDPTNVSVGTVLAIPVDPDFAKLKNLLALDLPGKEPDDFTVIIDGEEIIVESGRVVRTMDTVADGWTASTSWNLDDITFTGKTRPFAYNDAIAYLGGRKMVSGVLYTIENIQNDDGVFKNLEGFSYTADLIDSSVQPPHEQKLVTLQARIEDQVSPYGIPVALDPIVLTNPGFIEPFDKVTANKTDTVFDHLSSLAMQRGVLLSSTVDGELFITRTAIGKPVGTIEDNIPPGQEFRARFDGRARWKTYKAIGQSPGKKSKVAFSSDDNVSRSRYLTIQANETTAGNLQSVADWERSKRVAEALAMPFPVYSWYDPNGELWRENTLVTVKSPIIYAERGFDFLIRSVEYVFDPEGTRATLNLIPPQVYTGEPLEEPWADILGL